MEENARAEGLGWRGAEVMLSDESADDTPGREPVSSTFDGSIWARSYLQHGFCASESAGDLAVTATRLAAISSSCYVPTPEINYPASLIVCLLSL